MTGQSVVQRILTGEAFRKGDPITARHVCDVVKCSLAAAQEALRNLYDEGKLNKLSDHNGGRRYVWPRPGCLNVAWRAHPNPLPAGPLEWCRDELLQLVEQAVEPVRIFDPVTDGLTFGEVMG